MSPQHRRFRSIVLVLFFFWGGLLSANPAPLIVSLDHAWPPLSFLDDRGDPRGILIDLWREIGNRLNRPVEFRLTDWNESILQVRQGNADLHGGLFPNPERAEFLIFSNDLLPLSTVIYSRTQNMVLEIDNLGNRPVGVVAGSQELRFMEENHPNLNYQTFPNNETMVIAAVQEEIDAFAVDYPVGLYLLDRHADPGDFNVLNLLYSQHLQAGFAHESNLLRDQVNDVLRDLEPEDLRQITQKWISTEQVSVLPIWFYPALAILALVILLSYPPF